MNDTVKSVSEESRAAAVADGGVQTARPGAPEASLGGGWAHPTRRIGLVRHFPVEQAFPTGWKTAAELHRWHQRYDASPAILGTADLGSCQWTECLSSDLERAVVTARALFRGPVEQTPLLREADFAPFRTGALRLPVWVWTRLLFLAWATGHGSQRACRDEFRRRVVAAADLLEARTGDLLVVSHGVMMVHLSAELRRRGFAGPKLCLARHATLYLYQKPSTPTLAATASAVGCAHLRFFQHGELRGLERGPSCPPRPARQAVADQNIQCHEDLTTVIPQG